MAHKNINGALKELNVYQYHFDIEHKYSDILYDKNLLYSSPRDREKYLGSLRQTNESLNFLAMQTGLKSRKSDLSNLQSLRNFAVDSIRCFYEEIMVNYAPNFNNYESDINKLKDDPSQECNFESVKSKLYSMSKEHRDIITDLSTCVKQCGDIGVLLRSYLKLRSGVLFELVRRLQVEICSSQVKVRSESHSRPESLDAGFKINRSHQGSFDNFNLHDSLTKKLDLSGLGFDQNFDNISLTSSFDAMSEKDKVKSRGARKEVGRLLSKLRGTMMRKRSSSASNTAYPPDESAQSIIHSVDSLNSLTKSIKTSIGILKLSKKDQQRKVDNLSSTQKIETADWANSSGFDPGVTVQKPRYEKGKVGMSLFLKIVIGILETEKILANQLFASREVGKSVFLIAIQTSMNLVMKCGVGVGLSTMQSRYSNIELVFATLDTLERLRILLRKVSDQISTKVDQDTMSGIAANLDLILDGVPQDEIEMAKYAWDEIAEKFDGLVKLWQNTFLGSLRSAGQLFLQDFEKIPTSASVHYLSAKLVEFFKRLCQDAAMVRYILDAVKDSAEAYPLTTESQGDYLQAYAQCIFLKFLDLLESATSIDPVLGSLFALNNTNFIISRLTGDESCASVFSGTYVVKQYEEKLDIYKRRYLLYVWNETMYALDDERFDTLNSQDSNSHDGFVEEICEILNSSIGETFFVNALLEVPDPKLRQDLRSNILHNIIEDYTRQYECLKPYAKNRLHFSPAALSEIVAQFYYISESFDDPQLPLNGS